VADRLWKALHRTVGGVLPPTWLSRRYAGIPGRVHLDDLMLGGRSAADVEHYLDAGQAALANVVASLTAAGRSLADVERFLDLPCGYGRMLRHLVAHVPPARITAADTDRNAIRFCVAEFGVAGVTCPEDPRGLALPGAFDVVYVGSLLTHLPPATGTALLERLAATLAPRGVLVFTTQGESCLAHLDWYGAEFVDGAADLRAAVSRAGAGFVAYQRKAAASAQSPSDGRFGITILARTWVERTMAAVDPSLALVRFAERGLQRHQDVWAFARRT
jgi:SAM-dependent methyltransferase